jgi:hypothetical protein
MPFVCLDVNPAKFYQVQVIVACLEWENRICSDISSTQQHGKGKYVVCQIQVYDSTDGLFVQ